MIVLDVGSQTYGGADSISYLIREYEPRVLYGFDPAYGAWNSELIEQTTVIRDPRAAWIYEGEVGFETDRQYGQVVEGGKPHACFHLAAFINEIARGGANAAIILKLDCEGAEYTLISDLRANGADLMLQLCLVEWHCEFCGLGGNGRHREACAGDHEAWQARREATESLLRCETGEWNL